LFDCSYLLYENMMHFLNKPFEKFECFINLIDLVRILSFWFLKILIDNISD
jgi:hypothetical protein